jgi:hypothetical protein
VQITVSPCLPYSGVEEFGSLLLEYGRRVIVDSFVSGDGSSGRRTASTKIPQLYGQYGLDDWRTEEEAARLYHWLRQREPNSVGWSQAGFTALIKD